MKHTVTIGRRAGWTFLPAIEQGVEAPKNTSPAVLLGKATLAAKAAGADLQGAYLRGADLRGADLRGADLQGADLRGADLRGADLQGADLQGAYLRGAYLRGAYLRGADLRGADLRGAGEKRPDSDSVVRAHRATRSDGYEFMWFVMGDNSEEIIRAGCRTFSLAEFERHVTANYPGTRKAEETLRILAFLKEQAVAEPWS